MALDWVLGFRGVVYSLEKEMGKEGGIGLSISTSHPRVLPQFVACSFGKSWIDLLVETFSSMVTCLHQVGTTKGWGA